MSKFSSENQPKERRGRGKAERTRILEALERESQTEEGFYDELIRRAFNPDDNFAFKEVIQRLSPLKRATMPTVEFEFDEEALPHIKASQVMKATADGIIPPDVANMFVSSIASMMKIEEVTELSRRLSEIEKALGVDNG